jgi:hypothetical protein
MLRSGRTLLLASVTIHECRILVSVPGGRKELVKIPASLRQKFPFDLVSISLLLACHRQMKGSGRVSSYRFPTVVQSPTRLIDSFWCGS